MSVVSKSLKTLDAGRALLANAGLSPFRIFVRVRTWSGERVGDGAYTDTTTELTVAKGRPPQCRLSDEKTVVAPGQPMQKATFEVGPLTPGYDGGGVANVTLNPSANRTTEVHWVVMGPGCPSAGMLCRKIKEDQSSPFRVMLTLEGMGMSA